MSLDALTTLLREVRESGTFAAQVAEDSGILTGYDLTPVERDALLSEDEEALREMGVPGELAGAVRGIGRPARGYEHAMESERHDPSRPQEGNADAEFLVPDDQDEEREESRPEQPGQTGSGPEPGPPAEGRP